MDVVAALGAVSAATTLVQQAFELTQFFIALYGTIKEAPELIQSRLASIKQLTDIAELIKTTPPLQTAHVEAALEATKDSTTKLLVILQRFSLEDGGKFKRVSMQLKAALKNDEIVTLLDRIERNKSQLALCFLQIEASQTHSTNIRISEVSDAVGNVSVEVSNLEQKLTTKLDLLPDLASKVNSIYTELPRRFESIEKKLEELRTASTPIPVTSRIYEVPNQGVQRFVGREKILDKIKEAASTEPESAPQKVVLRAMGGQGKTQVALKFCSRMKKERDAFWIDASTEANVRARFASFAPLLQPSSTPDLDVDARVDVTRRCLTSWPQPWLVVFDNYDDPLAFNLDTYFPENEHGLVIITTRHAAVDQLADLEYQIQLPALSEDEAVELLMKETQFKPEAQASDGEVNKQIVARLGYHALAIAQAGSYIRTKKLRMVDFVDIFEREKAKILEQWKQQMSRYRKKLSASEAETSIGVFTTWELSYQQLEREDSGNNYYSDLLTLIAFFDSNDVSEELFQSFCCSDRTAITGMEHIQETIEAQNESASEQDNPEDSSYELYDLFKIPRPDLREGGAEDTRQDMIIISDLENTVKSINPHTLYSEDLLNRYAKAFSTLSNSYPGIFLQRLLAPIELWNQSDYIDALATLEQLSLIQHFERKEDGFYHSSLHPLIRDWIRIRTGIGRCKSYSSLTATCRYLLFREIGDEGILKLDLIQRTRLASHLQSCLDNRLEWFPDEDILPDHTPQDGNPELYFGRLFFLNGDDVRAGVCFREAYKHKYRIFGPKGRETLLAANQLAGVLSRNRDFEAIGELLVPLLHSQGKSTTAIEEKLTAFGFLARALQGQARYPVAEAAFRALLELSKNLLGDEHNDTIICMTDLANCLYHQNKYQEALELHSEVLRLRKEINGQEGSNNRYTLSITMYNLALPLKRLRRFEEAENLILQNLEMEKQFLSDDHHSVLNSQSTLADIMMETGRVEEAEELYREILASRTRTVGESHQSTLSAMTDLAMALKKWEKFDEAEALFKRVIELMEAGLGSEHRLTLLATRELATILRDVGRYNEASLLYLRLLSTAENVWGSDHADTLSTQSRYAVLLEESGKPDKAVELQRKVAETAARSLHPQDSNRLKYQSSYMLSLYNLKMFNECVEVCKELARMAKESLSPEDPDLFNYQTFQAWPLYQLSRFQEAVEIAEEVASTAASVLKSDERILFKCQYTYAMTLNAVSRYAEAEEFFEKAIEGLEKVAPPDDSDLRGYHEGQAKNLEEMAQSLEESEEEEGEEARMQDVIMEEDIYNA